MLNDDVFFACLYLLGRNFNCFRSYLQKIYIYYEIKGLNSDGQRIHQAQYSDGQRIYQVQYSDGQRIHQVQYSDGQRIHQVQ